MNRTPKYAALLLAAVAVAACGERNVVYPEPPAPPSIKSFTVSKTKINLGEAVTLSWLTEHATELEILDDAGLKVETTGEPAEGSVEVKPERTSFFVLRAKGAGGRDSAFVQVAVGEDLREAFLVAVPPEVDSGEPSLLLWSAHRAKSARLQTSFGQELPLNPAAGSGTLEVAPSRTAVYTLVASGVNSAETLTKSQEIKVRPVVQSAALSAGAAKVGEEIEIAWKTRGAGEVVVSEATFGELARRTFPAEAAQVDEGAFTFTVPATLPSGEAVQNGQPLDFTVQVKTVNPAVTISRPLPAHVGEGPAIVQFNAPVAVGEGQPLTLSWVTRNSERLQLFAGGALIHEPLPTQQGAVAQGSLTISAPPSDTTYELRAFSHLGARVSATQAVRVVKLPVISNFNLQAGVNSPGDAAAASWTTQHATRAFLRIKNGPNLSIVPASQVATGTESVYVGQSATVVLEAYNDAGDVVTEEREVTVAGEPVLAAGPSPVSAGDEVTVQWSFPTALAATVIGDPLESHLKNNPSNDWLDLALHADAKALHFDDETNGVAQIPLALPFRFPFVTGIHERFFVSVNGAVAFRESSALGAPQSLEGAAGLPPMLAPFWDDLELGDGEVLWVVEGASFPRRLIIQWNKVRTAADGASELTFQAQLWETGETHFIYQTLVGGGSDAATARIGWRAATDLAKDLQIGAPLLVSGDELVFLGSGQAERTWTYAAQHAGTVSPFVRTPAGRYIPFSAPLNVLVPGSVQLNEAMVRPHAAATEGVWVELFNRTGEDIDLSGTVLTSDATTTQWLLPAGTVIPANGFLVVGQSIDTTVNGGAPVDVAWTDLLVDGTVADTLTLSASSPLATLTWTAAQPIEGQSFQAPERAINASGTQLLCTRTETFGTDGAIGTPGAANETCFDYTVTSIPVAYTDISGVGTPFFTGDMDSVYVAVTLGAPVTYFGQSYTSPVTVSSNGWVTFAPSATSATANKTAPSTSDPTGTIAPFWEDLEETTLPGTNVYGARIPANADPANPVGHWIVQWHHFTRWNTTPDDDLNFQIKLFDDGVIEFHYAAMTSGSSSNWGNGNGATIWLENMLGTAALPVGINQAVISPHSAYRFTPKQ